MELLGQYRNGNYTVRLYDDGTKVRETSEDSFIPEFPESIDLKITNRCDMGCPFCHEASIPHGAHGDILRLPFLETLHPYTELAIGGGDPLSHPDLIPFLEKIKDLKLVANITVNQAHFLKNIPLLRELTDRKLIYGLGISYTGGDPAPLLDALSKGDFPNAVLHIICGVVSVDELKPFAGNGLNVLFLGYKPIRRGGKYYEGKGDGIIRNVVELKNSIPEIVRDGWFKHVSFDNLAIVQLNARRLMPDGEWEKFYMGDDGEYTMYIDAVNREYASSSVSPDRHPLEPDISTMFQKV